jgi:uncharacterized protein
MSSEPSTARPEQSGADLRVLLEEIARQLVDAPQDVSVEAFDEGGATVFELRVAEGDIGKIIGKQGRTARAFRNILAAVGTKLDHRFELEILE